MSYERCVEPAERTFQIEGIIVHKHKGNEWVGKLEVSNSSYCGCRVGSKVIKRVVSVLHIAQGHVWHCNLDVQKEILLSLSLELTRVFSQLPPWMGVETERRDQKFKAANLWYTHHFQMTPLSLQGGRGQRPRVCPPAVCCLLAPPVSILTGGARALVLPLSIQSGDGVGSTLFTCLWRNLSLFPGLSWCRGLSCRLTFLPFSLMSQFLLPKVEDSCDSQFKVPQDDLIILLCGLFASGNIIFSYPSWGRQETLNFSCVTRKALVSRCFHYLTGQCCHFHSVASFIVGTLYGDIFPKLWIGSGRSFSTFTFLLDSCLAWYQPLRAYGVEKCGGNDP